MRKKTIFIGVALLILIAIAGCTKNKFKFTRSEPTDIPYYNPVNDTCFICHNVSTLKKTITTSLGAETVPLYVNRDKFARSLHRGQNCLDCHTDIVLHKGHPDVPKTYGGWANFSAEDTLLTRNYTTQAAIACPKCHGRSSFLSSQHYLIGKITASHSEPMNGTQIGRDYDKAKCGKCHLTCATCHFKGARIQQRQGDVTDDWRQLLSGQPAPNDVEGLTNWAIDWTANVESHDFNIAEDLTSSNDMCRVCHTGYYTQYGLRGYTDSDTLVHTPIVSQGIQKYPKYEEWTFLSGSLSQSIGINDTLNLIYLNIRNSNHYSRKCVDCHDRIHSLTPITCLNCHDMAIPTDKPHSDVGCEACHDATMRTFRVIYSRDSSVVRAAAIRDNKVIDWRSHMIVNPASTLGQPEFCIYKCHNPVGEGTVGAPMDFRQDFDVHGGEDK